MGFTEVETPGQQPDPEFKAFFAGPWRELHAAVSIPGMAHSSWDRKAAYLLWVLGQQYDAVMPGSWQPALAAALKLAHYPKLAEALKPVAWKPPTPPPVGKALPGAMMASNFTEAERQAVVNPAPVVDCTPTPGGVSFYFDAMAVKP